MSSTLNRLRNDFNSDTTIQIPQTRILEQIVKKNINLYDDNNIFNIGTLNISEKSHTSDPSKQFFIQNLDLFVDEKYNKILLFGKYSSASSDAFIDVLFSNNKVGGSVGSFTPPSNLIQALSFQGVLKGDGFYHFSKIIDTIPKYMSFMNDSDFNITNLEIQYEKLQ